MRSLSLLFVAAALLVPTGCASSATRAPEHSRVDINGIPLADTTPAGRISNAATDGYQPMRQAGEPAIGIYKASPSSLADGEYDVLHTDANHNLLVTVQNTGTSSGKVQGAGASAAATVGNPVLVGGANGTNTYQLLTDQQGIAAVSPAITGWYVVTNTADTIHIVATCSKAAGLSGVKHVVTGVHAVIFGDGTGNADAVVLNLRDGATGAGVIERQWNLVLGTGANANGTIIDIGGLSIVGSAATAVTLETASAPAAHSIVTCALEGYDIKP